jgi:hypothetical protein
LLVGISSLFICIKHFSVPYVMKARDPISKMVWITVLFLLIGIIGIVFIRSFLKLMLNERRLKKEIDDFEKNL